MYRYILYWYDVKRFTTIEIYVNKWEPPIENIYIYYSLSTKFIFFFLRSEVLSFVCVCVYIDIFIICL